jgi:hypothetical protein
MTRIATVLHSAYGSTNEFRFVMRAIATPQSWRYQARWCAAFLGGLRAI